MCCSVADVELIQDLVSKTDTAFLIQYFWRQQKVAAVNIQYFDRIRRQ